MLQCLKQNKNSEVMDPKCKQMITKRQITQNTGTVFWEKLNLPARALEWSAWLKEHLLCFILLRGCQCTH